MKITKELILTIEIQKNLGLQWSKPEFTENTHRFWFWQEMCNLCFHEDLVFIILIRILTSQRSRDGIGLSHNISKSGRHGIILRSKICKMIHNFYQPQWWITLLIFYVMVFFYQNFCQSFRLKVLTRYL